MVRENISCNMECINFAFPYQDWDHDGGDGKQHYMRMLATRREVQINLLINTVFNLVLLIPLPVLCKAFKCFSSFLVGVVMIYGVFNNLSTHTHALLIHYWTQLEPWTLKILRMIKPGSFPGSFLL